jgi:hypothetical protein
LASTLDAQAAQVAGAPPAPSCEDGSPGLTDVAADEVILVYHPVRDDAWIGLALTRSHVVARSFRLDAAEIEGLPQRIPATLSERLFAPLEEILGKESGEKKRIRVFAADPIGAIDLHELAFPGATGPRIGERFSVTYGLDVPRAPGGSVSGKRALIVIPDLGILTAEANAKVVEAALHRAGWKVDVLRGAEATRAAVVEALKHDDVALLHFYGHGRMEGRDAWASGLRLHGDVLSVFDVLALDKVPELVVLGGCEPAATEGRSDAQGLTLAHAFLLAGAEHVLGSPRKIDAADTDDLLQELYEHHWPAMLEDPAVAVHDAVLQLRKRPYLNRVELPMLHVLAR